MARPLHVVVLAGGVGSRMKLPVPKVLLDLLGLPVIGHVLAAARALKPASIVVVSGAFLPELKRALADESDLTLVRQSQPLGTADAVRRAMSRLPLRGALVLILCGDAPLLQSESLRRLARMHRQRKRRLTVVTAKLPDPRGMGRIVRDARGRFLRIVEEQDATPKERQIREVNAGAYLVEVELLRQLLPAIGNQNAQGEYYLTDLVHLAEGQADAWSLPDGDEALGINDPAQLLAVRRILKQRVMARHQRRGVVIEDPDLTLIETGVRIASGSVVRPFCVIRRGVSIAARCVIGPFTHLRGGTRLAEGVAVGNFVELKAATLGRDSRALHLAYLGDARLGAGVNVGAGVVTANFDGRNKQRTVIQDGVSLGAGTLLIAPVRVGTGACTGAGSVIPAGQDVPPGVTVAGVPARIIRRPRRPGGSSTRRPGRRANK